MRQDVRRCRDVNGRQQLHCQCVQNSTHCDLSPQIPEEKLREVGVLASQTPGKPFYTLQVHFVPCCALFRFCSHERGGGGRTLHDKTPDPYLVRCSDKSSQLSVRRSEDSSGECSAQRDILPSSLRPRLSGCDPPPSCAGRV